MAEDGQMDPEVAAFRIFEYLRSESDLATAFKWLMKVRWFWSVKPNVMVLLVTVCVRAN